MLKVQITEKMIKSAQVKAKEMGELHNSIIRGAGNFVGFLGEEVVNSVLGGIIKNTKDYDLVYDGFTYDVKTKRCTSPPRPHYECSIAAFNTNQKCDRYIFVRIEYNKFSNELVNAWILGWYEKDLYLDFARKLKKGTRDGNNNFLVKADCYNLRIDELKTVKDLVDDELSSIVYTDELEEWWNKENTAFDNQKPLEILEADPNQLFNMLYKLKTGMPT